MTKDIEYLKMRSENFIKVGKKLKNFIIVDTTQPIDKVFAEVYNKSKEFLNGKETSSLIAKL